MKKLIVTLVCMLTVVSPIYGAMDEENATDVESYQCAYTTTLEHVANVNHVNPELLAAMNNVSSDIKLSSGDVIILPKIAERHHIVSKGQNLHHVAKLYGYDVKFLMEYNHIDNPNEELTVEFIRLPMENNNEDSNLEDGVTIESPPVDVSDRSLADSRHILLGKPLTGWVVSSPFGKKRGGSYHHGVDLAAPMGNSIYAAMDGVVEKAGYSNVYGRMLILDHGNGIKTIYGHSSQLLVDEGEQVHAGELIAKVGSTGNSTGPHLHLELRINGEVYDPLDYMAK